MPPEPSVEFAYLIGVVAGDGCITRAGHVFKLEISCDAAYPNLIKTYQALITQVTGLAAAVYKVHNRNCFRVVANSATMPSILGFPPGAKSENGFTIPEWIFENTEYVKALLRGLIETDGAVAKVFRHNGWYWHIHFCAKHPGIMSSFMRAVNILGYPFRLDGHKALLTNTALTKQMIADLEIGKCKEYIYS